MSLFIALVIGAMVGAVVGGFVMHGIDTLPMHLLAGVAGSVLGLGLYFFLIGGLGDATFFDGRATISSMLGSLVCVLLSSVVQRVAPRKSF
jgi:uncharacterized membrane protein SpoIIM required for sporulation